MANSEAGTSSDAAPTLRGEYKVFLSFKGLDTRYGFTDFLYRDLVNVGVRVFRDENELEEGEVIGRNLLRAIDNSTIYIPIFSQTYASSKWCLRELARIVDNTSKSEGKKSIFPIFFHVEPKDVELQTSLYCNALLEHKEKFPKEVEAWSEALAKVGKIKGWNVKKDESQANIVESVVKKVLTKLETRQKLLPKNLVGLDDKVEYLIEFLDVDHSDGRLIGIYGMGGIGKTTIARVIFNRLFSHFGKCCSFLDNVRENSSTEEGIVKLQKKLLSDVVGSGSAEDFKDSECGMRRIENTLSTKKILVVLDDVDDEEHIKKLLGNSSLHSGSRVIITTRNKAVLQVEGFTSEFLHYEMLKMDDGPALQLFYWHAFGGDSPLDDYCGLSHEIVSIVGGLPLAIEVIGSLLKRKHQKIWEETLRKLRKVSEKKILEKLKISYDDLEKHHKQIFLDIACFFFNKNKTDAVYMWTACQFYPEEGIEVLTDKCLVKVLDNDKFWMHDQLIALGRAIIREESQEDLEKQSRVWIVEEALQIIGTENRKDEVQVLEKNRWDGFIEITNKEFEWLPNLRCLKLRNGAFVGDFAKCHSKLRWISWEPSPRDFEAVNMRLDGIVVFKLGRNFFTDDSKAWDLIKGARHLKVLSLTECNGITTVPDFSKCLGLERLTLSCCENLKRIESFIGELQSLIELEINQCRGLTNLAEEVGALGKLKRFSLKECYALRELPGSIGNLTSLIELDLSKVMIRKLPNSIGKLQSLRVLHLTNAIPTWNHVWQLPSGIGMLVNLEEVTLSGNGVIGELPVEIGELSSLKILCLKYTRISKIPWTINMLHHLQTLNLEGCAIQELPELPTSLIHLFLGSTSLRSVPNLSNLTNLVELRLRNSDGDGSLHIRKSNLITGCDLRWIGRLSRLEKLDLKLLNFRAPLELASLSHLKFLELYDLDLKYLMQLRSSKWKLENLSTLRIFQCEAEDIPLDGLPQLEEIFVKCCNPIKRLSIPSELRKLREVEVSICSTLVEIQIGGPSRSLEFFSVFQCKSLRRISGLPYFNNLENLTIESCHVLTNVEGLNELESLKSLNVFQCPSLGRLIDVSGTKIPDDCFLRIPECRDFSSFSRMALKRYKEELKHAFAIIFHLGVKNSSGGWEFFGGMKTKNKTVTPDSVTYERLVDDAGDFGFRSKRMWYKTPGYCNLLIEIESNKQVKGMAQVAYKRGSIHLYVETGVDGESEGEYDDEMMEMLTEESSMKTDVYSDEDGAEGDVSSPDEDSDSAFVGESKTDGTSSVDDFRSEPNNAKCFEATRNKRQMRSRRIGHSGSVNEAKTTSMENRKNEDYENGEPANQNDVRSSCLWCGGVEHHESSCKATTEIEDEGDLSSVTRDRTVETDRIPCRGSGTGRASNPGGDSAERGRGRGIASSSRNSKGSRSGRDATSTSGRCKASNSGISISSISRSSPTLSSGNSRGSILGKGATLSSGRDTILTLGRVRGSTSRRDTTSMGTSSGSGKGIASSSRSSSTLSTRRGRGSISEKGTIMNLERGASLPRSSTTGRGRGSSSSPRSTALITGMGRGSTSGKRATVSSGTDQSSSSAKTEPQTPTW